MSIHKSDSNQLLVSLVVEHSRRATPPQEGEVEALRVPEPETDFSYSRPRGISSTIGEKHSLQPPNFESNRNPWYQERVFSTAVRGRSPSPEPDGSGSPGVLSGVIGTCFVSGTVPEEAEDEGACLASHTEQQAQHSHWRPFRREVTAADSKLTISGERLMSVSFEQLRSLPSLASLSEISVASNQLRNIDLRPIASCRSLQVLLLNDNLLEGVDLTPLASCTQLERLWLHRNKLKSIDLSPLAISGSALRSLYLGRNELEEINLAPLEKCSNLRALQLEGNTKLKEIDVTPLFACAELSSFEAPPHARLIVRELAALEAQRRSLEKLQVASEKGEISEKRDYGNVFSTKLVLPKVFRRRGIVLHWIQDNSTDALSTEDCGFLDEKGHDVDTRPFRPEGRAAAPAEKESSNVPHDESISPGNSHRECDISTDWEPGASSLSQQRSLVVMVVGMTTHRRISTCNLLETTSTFHVIQTSSVVGALDAIISTPDNIDLVLMEPSDFELLIEKTRKTSIPLCMPVVVIGPPEYERSGVFQRCVAHGAKGFISFPLDSRDARALMDVAQNFKPRVEKCARILNRAR
ncbi:hypothetical protein F1559_002260 [Cyanidiococcus yangmingshanensis]|uniref:Uncharacterized protein n=1 Tax=Cyanidiococcus yangmingshanensis TaxID=2690220 RepID=A0A7J7ICQ9_9RHOD|nr:hypothetical protein F1559_002260 [Cyanidiococcus yangmingshanensis]